MNNTGGQSLLLKNVPLMVSDRSSRVAQQQRGTNSTVARGLALQTQTESADKRGGTFCFAKGEKESMEKPKFDGERSTCRIVLLMGGEVGNLLRKQGGGGNGTCQAIKWHLEPP